MLNGTNFCQSKRTSAYNVNNNNKAFSRRPTARLPIDHKMYRLHWGGGCSEVNKFEPVHVGGGVPNE